jgi:hypothetical protein
MQLYETSLTKFMQNMRDQVPIILALFSGQGGQMILTMIFFRDHFVMDVELLGGGGRAAIEREMANRGKEALLPTLATFRSNEWPWKTDPTKGTGPTRLEDALACPVRPAPVG